MMVWIIHDNFISQTHIDDLLSRFPEIQEGEERSSLTVPISILHQFYRVLSEEDEDMMDMVGR